MSDSASDSVTALFRRRLSGEAKFTPQNLFDPKADCVTYFHDDVSTNSYQVDPFITLYYEPVSCKLVGYKVKCVRMIVRKIIEEMHRKPTEITFADVLDMAEKLSEDHRNRTLQRDQARESELAGVTLPELPQ